MQFNSLLVLTGLLSTLSFAIPQSPQQTQGLASDLESYILALETDTAFQSFASAIQTNAPLSKTVASFEASMSSLITARQTPTPGYLNALPTDLQSLFSSVYSVEYKMLEDNGFLTVTPAATGSGAAATGTSSKNDAVGNKVKVAGALAVGLVGAVMAL